MDAGPRSSHLRLPESQPHPRRIGTKGPCLCLSLPLLFSVPQSGTGHTGDDVARSTDRLRGLVVAACFTLALAGCASSDAATSSPSPSAVSSPSSSPSL